MDPLTQGTLGAAAALAIVPRVPRLQGLSFGQVALMGAAGGLAPDLDILIRSASDPLVAIEYHRHFTHALAFIPVGGPLAALPWLVRRTWRQQWWKVAVVTTLGYATHALLDACTTYGTLLLWPFSHARISWHLVSVIDPLFTLPLLTAVWMSIRRRSTIIIGTGLAWAALYLGLGFMQQQRALAAQQAIAAERGHSPERRLVLPSFMNNITWRSLYQYAGSYYVDKVRVTWGGKSCVSPGTVVPVVRPHRSDDPAERRAHELIRWFSSGWVARDPERPEVLGDLRYSFSPLEATPIWGIRERQPGELGPYRSEWVNNRSRRTIELRDLVDLVSEDRPDARCF